MKFEKGSKEWTMFNEYWKMCQKFWVPEDNDLYWAEVTNDINEFYKKYDKSLFAKGLCLALADSLDRQFQEKYGRGSKKIET